LIGLYSDGGVHAHINHCKALVEIAEAHGVSEIYIHAFTDGRDCDPKSGYAFIEDLLQFLEGKRAKLASVIGRYYAMDRDKRWERIRLAYDLLVQGKGTQTSDILGAIRQRYEQGETDEFLQPMLVAGHNGLIKDGDAVLCFNFRTDRPRQITMALTQQDFPEFGMHKLDLCYATMTSYDETFTGLETLFKNDNLQNTIGEVLAKAGKTQVRIAETEKYPHVTFFFSGGREEAFPGERRILIPSPKVPTYDLQPEMSAKGIADAIIQDMQVNKPDFICLNFANADMVGHTGVFQASVKAVETVDACLDKVISTALSLGYEALVIADHGNSDFMVNEDGSPNTAHTKNLVPCIFVADDVAGVKIKNGKLADIAPTILYCLGMEVPVEMDGKILIEVGKIPSE
jgi:2,3-bisphosphoglycerate-independent phosphoglycerate mutase